MKPAIILAFLFIFSGLSAQELVNADTAETVPSRVRLICVEPSPGPPLFIFDGYPIDSADLGLIYPDDVRNLYIVHKKRAEKRYGSAARFGVVAVESKDVHYIHVTDSLTGAPVAGASIVLVSQKNENDVMQIVSDDKGRVRIDQPGKNYSYRLTVQSAGYDSVTTVYQPAKQPFKNVSLIKNNHSSR